MLRNYRKVQLKPESYELKNVQDSIAQIFNQIIPKQIIDGLLLENITVVGGTPLTINHGLGIGPRGWILAKKNAQADVWQTVSPTPNVTMILNASATVTISLWVF